MSAIPLHLQRRIEQRWAARFVRLVESAALESIGPKGTVNPPARPIAAGGSTKPFSRTDEVGLTPNFAPMPPIKNGA